MRWLASHVGRRGAFLGFLALLDFAYGFSLLMVSAPQRTFDLVLPWRAWAVIWITVGVSCLTGVFMRFDRIQYTLASVIKWAWALLYIDLQLTQHVPRAWVSAIVWVAFGLIVMLVAGWPEPPPKLPPLPPDMETRS